MTRIKDGATSRRAGIVGHIVNQVEEQRGVKALLRMVEDVD